MVNDILGNVGSKRAEQARRILGLYSNVADCIPQPIRKAGETKPLVKTGITKKVSGDELDKARANFSEALAMVKRKQPGKSKKELAKEILAKAFDDNIISAEVFLEGIKKFD